MNDDAQLASTLNKPVADPLGIDFSKVRTSKDVLAKEQQIANELIAAKGEQKRAEIEQASNLASEQYKASKEIADKARTYVDDTRKKEAEFPYPEFHPTKDNAESLAGLFSIVSTLGVMLGSSGKQSGLNAMGAMSGMMKGWQQGRADLFKREKEEFDKEFNRIKVLREGLRKDLEDYMKLLPYDKEAAMYKAAEISAKTGSDSIINAYVKTARPEMALKLLESAGNLIAQREQKASDFEYQKKLKEYEIALTQQKTLTKMGTAGPQRAIYEATGKFVPSSSEAKAIQSAATSLRDIDNLRQRLKDPEIQTGLRALPSPLITRIKSLVGQDEAEVRNFVDRELTGSDKTTLFIKDAILMSFAVEQGLTGSRVPVFTQKVVGPILDPRAYDPKTYDSLLESRQKKLTDVFYDNNFDDNDIVRIARIQPVATSTQTPAPVQKATEAEVKAYADKYFGGDTTKASDDLKRKGFL